MVSVAPYISQKFNPTHHTYTKFADNNSHKIFKVNLTMLFGVVTWIPFWVWFFFHILGNDHLTSRGYVFSNIKIILIPNLVIKNILVKQMKNNNILNADPTFFNLIVLNFKVKKSDWLRQSCAKKIRAKKTKYPSPFKVKWLLHLIVDLIICLHAVKV